MVLCARVSNHIADVQKKKNLTDVYANEIKRTNRIDCKR